LYLVGVLNLIYALRVALRAQPRTGNWGDHWNIGVLKFAGILGVAGVVWLAIGFGISRIADAIERLRTDRRILAKVVIALKEQQGSSQRELGPPPPGPAPIPPAEPHA